MLNLDNINQKKTDIMNALAGAIRANDETAMQSAMTDWQNYLSDTILAEANGILGAADSVALANRGIRQLTASEKNFYNRFITSAKQEVTAGSVITGIGDALPETVIESVFDDLKQNHPLLDAIKFQNTTAITKMVLNKQGAQTATWDELNTPITKQLTGTIEIIQMTLCKLTAYMFVTLDMLDLGPAWVDRYTRETLSEALAAGQQPDSLQQVRLALAVVAADDSQLPARRQAGRGDVPVIFDFEREQPHQPPIPISMVWPSSSTVSPGRHFLPRMVQTSPLTFTAPP
jgi:HK97 family phage major capsid protein